jgi:hypothetical protein
VKCVVTGLAVALGIATLIACRGPVAPEERCADACEHRAKDRCSSRECARGCAFILDRIVEREDGNVIACISRGKGPCDDQAWAVCAATIGVHADGGPPAPTPAPEEE